MRGVDNLIILCAFVTVLTVTTANADPSRSVRSGRVTLDGDVLRLNLPQGGMKFDVIWAGEDGRQWIKRFMSRRGRHFYEMRDHPEWRGAAKGLILTEFEGVNIEVVKPSFKDEIAIFLEPEQWVPSTINYLYGHTFRGWPWQTILLVVTSVLTAVLCFLKRNMAFSLFLGFVIAWGAMDARSVFDHYFIVEEVETNALVSLIDDVDGWVKLNTDELAKRTWTHTGLSYPFLHLIQYYLAECRYLPYGSESQGSLLVTMQEGNLVITRKALK